MVYRLWTINPFRVLKTQPHRRLLGLAGVVEVQLLVGLHKLLIVVNLRLAIHSES